MNRAQKLLCKLLKEEIGKTSTDHDHYHKYTIDEDGNGKTNYTSGGDDHPHEIKDFKVLPGGDDEHTHKLEGEGDEEDQEDGSTADVYVKTQGQDQEQS